MRQLVKHARLGQREGTLEHALLKQPKLPRIEAVERANGGYVCVRLGHFAVRVFEAKAVNQIVDKVNYLAGD